MGLPTLARLCKPLVLLVGFLWPSYASYKSLEGRSTEPTAVWLTYWVVFSFINVLEAILDPLLGHWMPLYYPLKFGLILWLMLPQTRGAAMVYSHILMPLLERHEAKIDELLEAGKQRTEEWGAQLLPAQPGGQGSSLNRNDPEGGKTFREWEFAGQQAPPSQAGLRGRVSGNPGNPPAPAGGGLLGHDEAEVDHSVTRSELFRDRSQAAQESLKVDTDPHNHAKDS